MAVSTEYKVNFFDTDAMAVVHHANYIRWFEIGRVAYLRSIGRDATVCRYGEIKIGFLSDYNWITSETQSKISGMAMEYDTTVSNHERLEDGVRYVYQTAADEAKQCVTFTKFRFDTNKVVEFLAIDGKTGEVRDDVPAPASAKYHQGRLA